MKTDGGPASFIKNQADQELALRCGQKRLVDSKRGICAIPAPPPPPLTVTRRKDRMSEAGLLPCPFCGAGDTRIDESKMWTGMRHQLLSVTVIHWCNKGTVDGAVLKVTGKTQEEAIARWNKRTTTREEP